MRRVQRRVAVSALVLALGVLAGAAALAKPVVLEAQALRQLAYVALHQGFAAQAIGYADALLTRDPADTTALILKARALRMLGRYPESEAVARKAWASAKDDPGRYGAAVTLAQALSLQNHRTQAQLWLRRAVQYAPSDRARQKAEQDFNYVRAQNPLTLRFDASLRPSNNVNGGARDPLFEYLGIPFILSGDALALAGVANAIGVAGSYRLSQTASASNDLTFSASRQGVFLSAGARAQAPDAKNRDYTLGTVELGWSRRGGLGQQGAMLTTSAGLGHNWYGGASLSDYAKLGLSLEKGLAPGLSGELSAALERQWRADSAAASSVELSLSGSVTRQQRNGDQLRLTFGIDKVFSDAITVDHTEVSANLDWQRAQPVLGMAIGAAFGVTASDYAEFSFSTTGRHDVRVAASLTAELRQIGYMGFSPVLALDLSRNNSNIALYATQTVGISLSVKSNF